MDLRTLLATGANQVQLQAPVPLSTMSRWSGGCESACQEGALFRYVTTGRGVTIYVVDGVRSWTYVFVTFCVNAGT